MPVMKSCCCFKSIRNGSFASAIYTMVFYVILMTACTFHIHTVYENTEMLAFTLVLVCLSSVMVITSILLLIGLYAENGQLFIPWLTTITLTTLCDVLLALYLLYHSEMDPFKAVLFVFDFFICGCNIFCFACVFSYYKQCNRELLHLKYLTPPPNPRNDFEDLKKYDGFKVIKKQTFNDKRDQHLAQKNSHFVELSTISEDNEQISSERNTTIGLNDDYRKLIASDYGSDYMNILESRLISSAKFEDTAIE